MAYALGAFFILIFISEFSPAAPEVSGLMSAVKDGLQSCQDKCSPETVGALKEMLGQLIAMRRDTREFWRSVSQFVLSNLLLPVLTALLGYIFGTMNSKSA